MYNRKTNQIYEVNTFKPHENKDSHPESTLLNSKEQSEKRDASGVVEAGGVSGVDTTGEIAEVLRQAVESEGSGTEGSGTTGTKAAGANQQIVDLSRLRERLLQNLPGAELLRKQIEREIKHEIDYLHKKAMRMLRKPGKINYFEMNNILSKIRDLRGVLARLIKASAETLKALWLRYVHGIM